MPDRKLYKVLSPHCVKIVVGGKHIKAYINDKEFIVMSITTSDRYQWRQVYRDFRRKGVIIPELLKS